MGDEGFTWLSGLVTFNDQDDQERLFAHFVRGRPHPKSLWKIIDRGVMEFDHKACRFGRVATWDLDGPFPDGAHAFVHHDFVYFADPFPRWRVHLDPSQIAHQASYEFYSCLKPRTPASQREFDRDTAGNIRCTWKRDAETLSYRELRDLVKEGAISEEVYPWRLAEAQSGAPLPRDMTESCG